MTWLFDRLRWLAAPWRDLSDIARDLAFLCVAASEQKALLRHITKELANMAEREDAAYEKLYATITTVKDGWASLVAERDALKAALEDADADKAAAVQAALDADSNVDAEKVEAADAALADLIPPAEEPPAEPEA